MSKSLERRPVHRDITERDARILRFLWKWKVISTRALAAKFFPNALIQTAYRRLLRLAEAGFISSVEVNGRWQECWCLSSKGYKYIRPHLGDLVGEGFKSENPYHDCLATAFHLGEWLTHQPEYTQTFSEQQLRRIPVDLWEEWVPHSDSHRPDGYSLYFQGEQKIIVAFEAELTLKTKSRYESVVAFYDTHNTIQFVFWLVDSKVTLNSMKRTFESFHVREWSKHHFVLLSDFQVKGWRAPIIEGHFRGKAPADFLLHLPPTGLPLDTLQRGTQALLDTAKKPVIPKPLPLPANSENR